MNNQELQSYKWIGFGKLQLDAGRNIYLGDLLLKIIMELRTGQSLHFYQFPRYYNEWIRSPLPHSKEGGGTEHVMRNTYADVWVLPLQAFESNVL